MVRLSLAGLGVVAIASVAVAQAEPAARVPSDAVLRKALEARCMQRMEELGQVEKSNAEQIAWEISPIAVRGTYTGFVSGEQHVCALGTSQSAQPTGTMRYQEVVYEKAGKTLSAAQGDEARPIEINEITEIFIYRDGAWR